MEKKEIFQEIVCLDASKAGQDTDIPTKIIKENAHMFTDFIHPSIMPLSIMVIFGQVDSTEFTESAEYAENYNYVSSLIK